MTDVTKWTNMANGVLAFSCQRVDPSGDLIEIPSFYCWTLRINLVIQVLMVLPFLWKLPLYYKYYGNQLFRSRQRIIYLCILYGISTCLAFSVFNMVAIYYISFFVAQLLYWHVLGYFMIKLGKLARGPMMFCLNLLYWLIFTFFIVYLATLLYFPLPSNFLFCPGLIDTQYWIYKSVVIISLLVLYAFASIVLTKLLSQESESLLDLKRRKKRSREFAKLKTLILIVWISELSHLVVTVTHYYLSIGIDRCSLFVNDENGLLESLSISFYRSIVIYAPLLALLWMLWLPNDEIQKKFNENYTDESLDFDTRFATRLTFRTGSQMRTNSQTSPAGYVYKGNLSDGSDG